MSMLIGFIQKRRLRGGASTASDHNSYWTGASAVSSSLISSTLRNQQLSASRQNHASDCARPHALVDGSDWWERLAVDPWRQFPQRFGISHPPAQARLANVSV